MRTIAKVGLLGLVLLALMACQLLPGRGAGADLAGTSWVLSSLGGDMPLPGTTVTLQFDADGAVSGSDGCNRFRTTFSQRGDRLTFDQPGASTMMACPEPVMDQATAFMAALAETTRFTVSEEELILRDGNEDLATLAPVSQDLADSAWDVVSYNNGREAVVGVLLGTEISANFGADGQVSGNAGCNQYFASYSVDGNAIEIGQAATTFMFCEEPPGVMEQESAYLAALQSAATYRIEGDMLEMRTAADQIAVMMTRKSRRGSARASIAAHCALGPRDCAAGRQYPCRPGRRLSGDRLCPRRRRGRDRRPGRRLALVGRLPALCAGWRRLGIGGPCAGHERGKRPGDRGAAAGRRADPSAANGCTTVYGNTSPASYSNAAPTTHGDANAPPTTHGDANTPTPTHGDALGADLVLGRSDEHRAGPVHGTPLVGGTRTGRVGLSAG